MFLEKEEENAHTMYKNVVVCGACAKVAEVQTLSVCEAPGCADGLVQNRYFCRLCSLPCHCWCNVVEETAGSESDTQRECANCSTKTNSICRASSSSSTSSLSSSSFSFSGSSTSLSSSSGNNLNSATKTANKKQTMLVGHDATATKESEKKKNSNYRGEFAMFFREDPDTLKCYCLNCDYTLSIRRTDRFRKHIAQHCRGVDDEVKRSMALTDPKLVKERMTQAIIAEVAVMDPLRNASSSLMTWKRSNGNGSDQIDMSKEDDCAEIVKAKKKQTQMNVSTLSPDQGIH